MGKIEKVENSKMVESEYEIRTDLPSARTHSIESDERDLSPAVCNTRFIKEHKPSNHIRARIKSHVYTTE